MTVWRLGCLVGVAIALFARPAHADVEFQFATNVNAAWMREAPRLGASAVSTSARDIGEGKVATRGGLFLAGGAFDLELTVDDKWKVPLIGAGLYANVGERDAVVSSLDGSAVRLRPWTAVRGDVLLPGVGRRWKQRRNMWGIALRTGASFVRMRGTVAAGTETYSLDLMRATFVVQMDVEWCRRLDPTLRVCAQVSPRVYDHEALNGITGGLRFEWGR